MANGSHVTIEILHAIRRSPGPISKAELVRHTNYGLATVSEHVQTLLQHQVILESDKGVSTGGRKPRLLSLNADAGRVLAIDLESRHVAIGVTDLGCSIACSTSSDEIDVARGPFLVLNKIKDLAFNLLKENGVALRSIKGIGMGVPGPVKFSAGLPASLAIMPGWESFPIAEFWKGDFDCPCRIDNNVHTMALGEWTAMLDPSIANLIVLKVGNGIGAGIICNGEVYRGSTENAGEVGHIYIGHDMLCYCGNRGCLEAFAGGRAIAARAVTLAQTGRSQFLADILALKTTLSLADVTRAVEASDAAAVELIRECGNAIGEVLAGLVNFFNPSHVSVGGGVSSVGDLLLAAIRQAVYRRALPLGTRNLVIQNAVLGVDAGLVGAAMLTLDDIFRRTIIESC
jgi:predicted NBD/HSP70 family sugar kinase